MMERDETRERFLGAIAERITPDDIAEAHLFPPIRQGGMESGVAVIAVKDRSARPVIDDPIEEPSEATISDQTTHSSFDDESTNGPVDHSIDQSSARLTVYTAKYRLTLKGPERGRWEFSMNAEADAPLLTIDKVVRGVQQRSGDAEDPVKLVGDEFRALLPAAEENPAER